MGKLLLNGIEYAGSGDSGASSLAELEDVSITSPSDGQVLRYNGQSQEWENGDIDISPFSVVSGKVCITYQQEV